MKRLIGATALAILGLSYSAQAAVEPDPGGGEPVAVEDPVAVVAPEVVVWTGDVKDHVGYGPVVVVFELPRPTGCCDHLNVRPAVNMPSGPVRPCASGFVNRVPC